jgi:hypothetical protein
MLAPTIMTIALPDGTVGMAYSHTLAASGGGTVTWTLDAGALPKGLTLSGAGVISGIPTTAGTETFTVRASNGVSPDAAQLLSITINPAPEGTGAVTTAPMITTTALPTGTVGAAYSQTLVASGDGTVTWTLDAGALPKGLTLSGAGVISGIPTAAGTETFTVRASNGVPPDATTELSIRINARRGGGGCDAGYGLLGLSLAALAVARKSLKK